MNPAEHLFIERYINNPRRNLLRFSFVFMILGIVLSVGILTAALNLFEGYERALKSALLDSFPHVRIQSTLHEFMSAEEASALIQQVKTTPEVATATPMLSFSLMSFKDTKVRGSVLNAFNPAVGDRPAFVKYVRKGSPELAPGKVIVGHYLAQELGLGLGDTLQASYPRLDRITPLGMTPNIRPLVISGIYRSGYYEYDRSILICSIQDAQAILGNAAGFNSIELKLKNEVVDRSEVVAMSLGKQLGQGFFVAPVANTTLLSVVKMQKWLIFIIFSFLVLIAGINVISGVGTLIFDKKNEIAVLKALGAAAASIRRILGYQMVIVCLASILVGQLFGYILSLLAVKQNFYKLKGDVYFIDKLELYVSLPNQAIIFAVASLLVLLCIYLPLRKIDKMQAIELLRNA